MTYRDIYERAKAVIGEENIVDFSPTNLEYNAIKIWLKNGDVIIYRAL